MGWLPVFKKEMRLYFTSPVAYVVGTFFLLIAGWFFTQIFFIYSLQSMQSMMNPMMAGSLNPTEAIMRPVFSNMSVVMLFFIPMLTMRLFAEEKKSGTLELLLTYPVRDGEVLLGKFLAALALFTLLILLTLLYPALIAFYGRVEWGAVASGYLGLFLLAATFLAVGVFISSLTENQIVAGFSTFGVLLAFWVIGWGADSASGWLRNALQYVSVLDHMESFGKGVIDTKDILYYVVGTALALFLTLRSLETKRWN